MIKLLITSNILFSRLFFHKKMLFPEFFCIFFVTFIVNPYRPSLHIICVLCQIILSDTFCPGIMTMPMYSNNIFVTVHSYLVPVTIYAHKINKIDFGAFQNSGFHSENTSRNSGCEQLHIFYIKLPFCQYTVYIHYFTVL